MDTKYYLECVIGILVISYCSGDFFGKEDDESDDTPFNRCPWIRNKLKNGRVKIRNRGRIAKFLCDPGYELAGKRFSTCVRGQWNNPIPVCVARGCFSLPEVPNSRVTEAYRGAVLMYDCLPGYSLDGPSSLYCDGRRWTSVVPTCVVAVSDAPISCDFEDPELCGWSQDPTHDFDWKRNQFSTPSGHAGTGPTYDHTYGSGKGGFYLYQEASAPRKPDDISRLFSPVYSADRSGGCFLFWYHMYGSTIGGLKVFVKPESHVFGEMAPTWELYGDQGDVWIRANISVPRFSENFQVVIEGIRGANYIGDTAIDDVYLSTATCDEIGNSTDHISFTASNSCRGRCRETDNSSYCGCNDDCHANGNCCYDFMKICTGTYDPSEIENPPEEQDTTTTPSKMFISTENATSEVFITNSSPSTGLDKTISINFSSTTKVATDSETEVSSLISNEPKPSIVISSTTVQPTSKTSQLTTTPSTTSTKTSSLTMMTTTSFTTTTTNPFTITSTTPPAVTVTLPSTTIISSTTTSSTITTTETPLIKLTSTIPSTISSLPSTVKTSETTFITLPVLKSSSNSPITTSMSTRLSIVNFSSPTTPVSPSTHPVTKLSSVTPSSTATSPLGFSSIPTTITFLPLTSTRKTYNLRPRNRTSLPTTTTSTARSAIWPYRIITQSSSTTQTSTSKRTTWSYRTTTTIQPGKRTTWSYRTTPMPFTYKSRPSTLSRSSTTLSTLTSTEPSMESMDRHASESASVAMNSSQPTITIILVIVLIFICVVAGAVYIMKRRTQKRQSKLSDDSEMRFLSENEVVEYSDPAALEKMLAR